MKDGKINETYLHSTGSFQNHGVWHYRTSCSIFFDCVIQYLKPEGRSFCLAGTHVAVAYPQKVRSLKGQPTCHPTTERHEFIFFDCVLV